MKGRQNTCCFTGHRPEKLPWGTNEDDARCLKLKNRIRMVAEDVIRKGFEHFICGMAAGCDTYFSEIILDLKREYPFVSIEAAIPCPTQADRWSAAQQVRYRNLIERCDTQTMVQAAYSRGCMQRRNRYMVDHSCLLIAAHDGLPGGTRNTIAYALQRGVSIVDIPI